MGIEGEMKTDRRKELLRLSQKAAEILKKEYHVKRVFLIGSLVKGIVHEKSDIDIVVEGLAPELYIKALTRIYDVLPPGVELNLIPFEDAFDSLKKKTVEKGMLIHE
ncbi:MAG: nucleotidyltransferase domain-containing protein [Nitrospirae bacterium]|nr:nucleotidyltransferase domain-containing protein [Nitrospirota bacterium]